MSESDVVTRVRLVITGDNSNAKAALKDNEQAVKVSTAKTTSTVAAGAKKQEEEVKKSGSKMSKMMGSSGAKMAAGLAAGLAGGMALQAGIGFASDSIHAASDLAESVSKMNVVFGDSAGGVEKYFENSAKKMGMSKQAAIEAAATYGNLFVSMGMGKDVSADMSEQLVTLAGDLASFNNANPADTLHALRSGLTGEPEALKKFGVNLNAVAVQAKAIDMGLVKSDVNTEKVAAGRAKLMKAQEKLNEMQRSGKASAGDLAVAQAAVGTAEDAIVKALQGKVPTLSAAQKAQATYALILEQTKTAQGDYARTADGVANSERTAAAQVEDLKAAVGKGLMPIYQSFLQFGVNTLIPFLTSMAQWFGENSDTISTVVKVVAALAAVLLVAKGILLAKAAAMMIWRAAQVAGSVATDIATAAQWAFNVAMSANPIGLLIIAIAALVAGLVWFFTQTEAGQVVLQAFGDAFRWIWEKIQDLWNWVSNNWPLIFKILTGPMGFAIAWIVENWETVKSFFGGIPDFLMGIGKAIYNAVTWPWRTAIAFIIDAWNNLDIGFSYTAPDWVPGIGGNTIGVDDLFPDIASPSFLQGLATGGIVNRAGMFTVGEQGKENVFLPAGAAVIPNSGSSTSNAYGGITINVDARGTTDLAAVKRSAEQGVKAALDKRAQMLAALGGGTF